MYHPLSLVLRGSVRYSLAAKKVGKANRAGGKTMKGLEHTGRWLRSHWRRLAIFLCLIGAITVAYTVGRSGAAVPEADAVPPRTTNLATMPQQGTAAGQKVQAAENVSSQTV